MRCIVRQVRLIGISLESLRRNPAKPTRIRKGDLLRVRSVGGNCFKITFGVTLSDVEGQRPMLARHVRIVRQQLWTGGTAKPIEPFCAGTLYKMSHFEG